MRFEDSVLVSMNDVQNSKTRNKLVDKHASYCELLLTLQCVRLNVFSKMIDDFENVSVATLSA